MTQQNPQIRFPNLRRCGLKWGRRWKGQHCHIRKQFCKPWLNQFFISIRVFPLFLIHHISKRPMFYFKKLMLQVFYNFSFLLFIRLYPITSTPNIPYHFKDSCYRWVIKKVKMGFLCNIKCTNMCCMYI